MDLLKEALLKSKQLCAAKLTHIPFGTGLLQADTCSQGHAMEVFSRAPQQDGILPCPRLPPGLCLLGPCSLVKAPSLILYPSPPFALPWGPFWCWVQEGPPFLMPSDPLPGLVSYHTVQGRPSLTFPSTTGRSCVFLAIFLGKRSRAGPLDLVYQVEAKQEIGL